MTKEPITMTNKVADCLKVIQQVAGICNIDAANPFLARFVKDYNQRFAIAPQNSMHTGRCCMVHRSLSGYSVCMTNAHAQRTSPSSIKIGNTSSQAMARAIASGGHRPPCVKPLTAQSPYSAQGAHWLIGYCRKASRRSPWMMRKPCINARKVPEKTTHSPQKKTRTGSPLATLSHWQGSTGSPCWSVRNSTRKADILELG